MPDANKRAQEFLALVKRRERGKLKLYIGFAAGVGKTYRMLEEAQALAKQHVDIVLAYIETHDRADTQRLVDGLEVIGRRRVEYRGVTIEEMNLDAVLARKPQIAVVDELAHTNIPGSRNKKRYQDVIELLDAGISVIGAFNIQHLDSLNDLVARTASVQIRETIPDSFLKQSDQVVNLDLAVEDLVERLKAGKIYSKEKIGWALENFFKEHNLSTLRELALREVAESLERSAVQKTDPAEKRVVANRVMVCMSSHPPHAAVLLRRGSRMAGRLSTDWFVVYVETPRESPERIDAEAQRHLMANIDAAREQGAEVVRLKGKDPVETLLDFARAHGVGNIIIGRSQAPWWRQMLGRSIPLRLAQEAKGFDVHIISFTDDEARP